MINYRNSCQYLAGILVPLISFFIFEYVEDEREQFSTMANISIVLGFMAFSTFVYLIREKSLVAKSSKIYDEYFMIDVPGAIWFDFSSKDD